MTETDSVVERSDEQSMTTRSLSWPAEFSGKVLYWVSLLIGFAFLITPIVIIVPISFNPANTQAYPPQGLSLRWYTEFFLESRFFEPFFFVSLPIAVVSALISTAIGIGAAYALVRQEVPFEDTMQTVLLSPLTLPAIITGFGLLLVFAEIDIGGYYTRIIAGHVVISLPFTVLTARTSIEDIDLSLHEAARNLGASKYQAFLKITLPMMKTGAISGFLIAFILSFTDVSIALFLVGGDVVTLPVEIFMYLQYHSGPIIAAVSTLQILLIMVMVIVVGKLVGFKAVIDR